MITEKATELAKRLINKDYLEMTDEEMLVVDAPAKLEVAHKEIERLRALAIEGWKKAGIDLEV
jgi:hypothetical protein